MQHALHGRVSRPGSSARSCSSACSARRRRSSSTNPTSATRTSCPSCGSCSTPRSRSPRRSSRCSPASASRVEGRALDLLLCGGFFSPASATLAFSIAPVARRPHHRQAEAWAGIGGRFARGGAGRAAPFVPARRIVARKRALLAGIALRARRPAGVWLPARTASAPASARSIAGRRPPRARAHGRARAARAAQPRRPARLRPSASARAATTSTAGSRSARRSCSSPRSTTSSRRSSERLRLAGRLPAAARLRRPARRRLARDPLAEFGRAVAEERARVAREIHDGLAQYLFAVSTHAAHARDAARDDETLPRLKEAAAAAQQEARFAVLALSSASGTAPFDAALRRYVEFLTADGALEVELEIDPAIAARARRADRGLPDRPGGPRERAPARGRAARPWSGSASARGRRLVSRPRRRRRLRRRGRGGRPGTEEHAPARRHDRGRLRARAPRRGAAPRSRSSCARSTALSSVS